MPILSNVARRHPTQIAARVLCYGFLTFGAMGILYPMLLVFGQALSNEYDLRDNALWPSYLFDRNELALKYAFSLSPKKLHLLASRHQQSEWKSHNLLRADTNYFASRPAFFATTGLSLEAWKIISADLNAFKQTLDPGNLMAVDFRIEDYYRPFLKKKYGHAADSLKTAISQGAPLPKWLTRTFPDPQTQEQLLSDRDRLGIAIMNEQLRSDYLNYYSVEIMPAGNYTVPAWRLGEEPKMLMWRDFLSILPSERKLIISSDTYWHDFLSKKYVLVSELNKAWGSEYTGFYELTVPLTLPEDPRRQHDWEQFVINRWPRRLLITPPGYDAPWRDFVRTRFTAKFPATTDSIQILTEFNTLADLEVLGWHQLQLPARLPDNDLLRLYWNEFTASAAIPAVQLQVAAPEVQFRQFLQRRYRDIDAFNSAWQSDFATWDVVPLPLAFYDYGPAYFEPNALRWQFISESFVRILEYILGRGSAAQNTLILCLLSLAAALTVNPLAAYSLSRFSLQQSHKVLIFFLATMAFPAEVAMIPNFLLLRDLDLLNSYAALVLPGMANGYSIFLLKGFFDSLPKELYEAAELDGAGELQIFRMVALPMLTPILAYIGLNTFVLAYSGFLWAFVICPQEEMWTLMVWVYDFQSRNPGNNYIMAATILVSIPPLIVFLFANRIIMRGIIIPSMK